MAACLDSSGSSSSGGDSLAAAKTADNQQHFA
jgi:hypothetical protein